MKAPFLLAGLALMVAAVCPTAPAKDHPVYDKAVLLSMQSAKCGSTEGDHKTLAGEILGTDSSKKQSEDVLCQEYVLQDAHVIYHIRPTDQKHPLLLPIGDSIQFRIHKDKFYLLDAELDKKERVYTVVAMEPRPDVSSVRFNDESR